MSAALAAGIGAATNLIGGFFGNKSRKRESARQREWSESMWKRQNAYNTPANQMQRLRDAGLNPALMYGQGTMGNAEKALPYQQAQIESVGANVAQSAAAGAQASLAKSQEKLNNANAAYQGIAGSVKAGEFGIAKELAQYTMDNLTADTLKKGVEATNIAVDTTLKDTQIQLNKEQKDQVSAKTQQIIEDTNLTKKIIEKDYDSGSYGKNLYNNTEQFLENLGVDTTNPIDLLSTLSVVGVARNPVVLSKIAGKAVKSAGNIKRKYYQLKGYIMSKFGKSPFGSKKGKY
jgi:ribosomal protein L25 (general stress protein Ctc)